MTNPGSSDVDDLPALRLRNVSKVFPGQRALDAVDLDMRPGKVHGLVGQNGSGKSTLIKILAGFHKPEPGAEAWMNGDPFPLGSLAEAGRSGIRFIHQDLGLIPTLDTVDNLALGRGFQSHWWISLRGEASRARKLMSDLGFGEIDIHAPVGTLAPVQRSMIAIARALRDNESGQLTALVLDEPTESLPKPEVRLLFEAIRHVAARGAAVLYVSHRLDEVLEISDEITVLREGMVVASRPAAELDQDLLVQLIVGSRLEDLQPAKRASDASVALRVARLEGAVVRDISFDLFDGEILGVAGLVGSGREELPYLLAGARPAVGGVIEVDGSATTAMTPRSALHAGLILVAADRQKQSTVPTMTVRENVTLPRLEPRGPLRWIAIRRERVVARSWIERTGVTPPIPDRPLATLSGGNQQKVVLAKAFRCDPRVLVLDEPVQGVDVGARISIFQQLLDVAAEGVPIVVSSSEPQDLAAVCDRVLVLRGGVVAAELAGKGLTVDRIVERSLATEKEIVA